MPKILTIKRFSKNSLIKCLLLVLLISFWAPIPAHALFKPEPDDQVIRSEYIPLGVGVLTIVGVGGLVLFVKKEKSFMKRHVFRFEKIKKKLREEDYED